MRQQIVNTFSGGVDKDLDLHEVPNNKLVGALNILRGRGATLKAVTNMKGNATVGLFVLPDGTNIEVGAVEDKTTGTVIYFMYNSSGNLHSIYRYFPNESVGTNGRIELLMLAPDLNFSPDWRIHSTKVIDGKLLYWAGAAEYDGEIEGNPPRKINIEKASTYQKILTYELVLSESSYNAGISYQYFTTDPLGSNPSTPVVFYTVPAGPPAKNVVINQLRAAFLAENIDTEVTLINADGTDRLIVSHQDPETRIELLSTGDFYFAPINHYPTEVMAQYMTVIKPVPKCAPKPRYQVSSDDTDVRVFNYAFQFRYRYVFDDGERSAWSAASYVPTNFVEIPGASITMDVENSQLYNKIRVDIEDDLLSDNDWRCYIRYIELAVRYDEAGIWRFVKQYPIHLLGCPTFSVYFNNESTLPAIPSDEASAADQQALKNFDFVPRLSLTTEMINDEFGNSIMAWAGNLENYPFPETMATVEVLAEAAQPTTYPGDQTSLFKGLKSGGVYRVFVVYEDFYGRQAVAELDRVRVPFSQVGDGLYYLKVTFLIPPPLWAVKYRIAISQNQNQSDYVQLPAFDLTYWIYNSTDDKMEATSYGAGDANYVGFEFNVADLNGNVTLRNYIFDTLRDNNRIFLPEPRDRIQILNWDIHTGPSLLDLEDYNYSVEGYSLTYPNDTVTDPAYRFSIFIKFDPSQPNFDLLASSEGPNDWYLIELYRPGAVTSDEIAYEFGDCYDVIDNPDPLKRTHGPAVSLQNWGDTYSTSRKFGHKFNGSTTTTVEVPHVQRKNLYVGINEVLNDLGRVVAFDPNYDELYSYDQIRVSGIYVPSSKVNDLSAFRGADYVRVNRQFGSVNKLALIDRVLLAICKFKSQPIYVGKERVVDLSGASLIGRSSSLLNLADELVYDLGTHNPESVVVDEGKVMAWDVYKGTVWNYTSGGGQKRLSDEGFAKFFLDFGIEAFTRDLRTEKCFGGIDRQFGIYYLTFDSDGERFTIGYDYEADLWNDNYGFLPEGHAFVGLKHITFKDGRPWLHNVNPVHCSFYGEQSDCYVIFVVNAAPEQVKLFWSMWEEATTLWTAPEITIPETPSYPGGMSSQLIANKFTNYEGQPRADFLRDQSDPSLEFSSISDPTIRTVTALLKGRPLRGEVMVIKLQLDDPTNYSILRSVRTLVTPSSQ